MSNLQQQPDGSWVDAEPVAFGPGLDGEIRPNGSGHEWDLYDDAEHVTSGTTRTKAGAYFAIARSAWKHQRAQR